MWCWHIWTWNEQPLPSIFGQHEYVMLWLVNLLGMSAESVMVWCGSVLSYAVLAQGVLLSSCWRLVRPFETKLRHLTSIWGANLQGVLALYVPEVDAGRQGSLGVGTSLLMEPNKFGVGNLVFHSCAANLGSTRNDWVLGLGLARSTHQS